jgi:hypothetical protein
MDDDDVKRWRAHMTPANSERAWQDLRDAFGYWWEFWPLWGATLIAWVLARLFVIGVIVLLFWIGRS